MQQLETEYYIFNYSKGSKAEQDIAIYDFPDNYINGGEYSPPRNLNYWIIP